ncbi:MAG: hypothetical protein OEY56_05660 [Cyclobacteriaceae bacterium]|nr:hypothetical protein [Cyclobacteriaceae bacterium]
MNSFAITEFYNFDKVRFYTVQFTDIEFSETDRFIKRFESSDKYGEFLSDILSLIAQIGERGAQDYYFNRNENDFQALPNKEKARAAFQGENLRLYCLRLSNSIVVLFNGGVKDAPTAQESTCSIQFYEAFAFTKRISEALREGTIEINGNILVDYKGSTDIIL